MQVDRFEQHQLDTGFLPWRGTRRTRFRRRSSGENRWLRGPPACLRQNAVVFPGTASGHLTERRTGNTILFPR